MINEKQKSYQTTREEQHLRWKLYCGVITQAEFDVEYKKLKSEGKIVRSGKVVTE